MATVRTNDLIDGLSGKLGNALVFRTMRGKTHVSLPACKPDKKKESSAQRNTRSTFKEAAEWAQTILLDPEKKTYYKQRAKALKLPNAYTAAITDYMRKAKVAKSQHSNTITYHINKPGFKVQTVDVQVKETAGVPKPKVVIRQDKNTWFVHYTPDENTIDSTLTLVIIDHALRETRYIDVPV